MNALPLAHSRCNRTNVMPRMKMNKQESNAQHSNIEFAIEMENNVECRQYVETSTWIEHNERPIKHLESQHELIIFVINFKSIGLSIANGVLCISQPIACRFSEKHIQLLERMHDAPDTFDFLLTTHKIFHHHRHCHWISIRSVPFHSQTSWKHLRCHRLWHRHYMPILLHVFLSLCAPINANIFPCYRMKANTCIYLNTKTNYAVCLKPLNGPC